VPTALDNGRRSPRKLRRAVVARLLGRKPAGWSRGDDLVFLGDGLDYAEDSRGDDLFVGGGGDDVFVLGTFRHAGRDLLRGGRGSDTLSWSSARFGSSSIINLTTGRVRTPSGRDTARSIENASTARGDDTLIGNAAANYLDGSKGDDHIEGRGGDDALEGVFGNDDDVLDGGDGFDTCLDGETILNCEA
jgi:Ca2+-binding RTX toxin-like protein